MIRLDKTVQNHYCVWEFALCPVSLSAFNRDVRSIQKNAENKARSVCMAMGVIVVRMDGLTSSA